MTNWLHRLGGLRWRFRNRLAGTTPRNSERSRRDLLDEIYYLRDVAGERGQRIAALQARMVALQGELAALRAGSVHLVSPGPSQVDDIASFDDLSDECRDATPCLFVDVTELATNSGQTGIQRVVREILRALLDSPPDGYRVEAIYATGRSYRYARTFARGLCPGLVSNGPNTPIRTQKGDVFLGLDHSMGATVERATALETMRQQGVRLWFVCNDCLPLSHPEWFPPEVHATFKAWLGTLAQVADGIACISRATEDELRRQLDVLQPVRQRPLRLGHFHLGADMPTDSAVAEADIAPEQAATLERLRTMPSFLTVGTLEPRKGYAQALQAFELLWEQDENVAWVIVGLPGWMTDVVQRRIRHHDEFGWRLFWFIGAGDALLGKLYTTCTALLAPSEDEGYGLPLAEAARYGLPILCRDLPVFREVTSEHATYFSGHDAESLAGAVSTWLGSWRGGAVPATQGMRWITWAESARQLMSVVLTEATAVNPRQSS